MNKNEIDYYGNTVKVIAQISIPIIFLNLFDMASQLADAFVSSSISLSATTAIVAVSSIAGLIGLIQLPFLYDMRTKTTTLLNDPDQSKIRHVLDYSVTTMTLLCILLIIPLFFFKDFLLSLTGITKEGNLQLYTYASMYYHMVITIRIPVSMWTNLLGGFYNRTDFTKVKALFGSTEIILNIALNFILLERFGIYGIAFATLFSKIVYCVLYIWHSQFIYKDCPLRLMPNIFKFSNLKYIWKQLPKGMLQLYVKALTKLMVIALLFRLNSIDPVYAGVRSIAISLEEIIMCVPSALELGLSKYVGFHKSQKSDKKYILDALKVTTWVTVLVSVLGVVLLMVIAPILLPLVVNDYSAEMGEIFKFIMITFIFLEPFQNLHTLYSEFLYISDKVSGLAKFATFIDITVIVLLLVLPAGTDWKVFISINACKWAFEGFGAIYLTILVLKESITLN